jgi:hypothetical protein
MPFDPVKVICGETASWQTVAVPEMAAVGSSLTVIVAEPACAWEHERLSCTLTRL